MTKPKHVAKRSTSDFPDGQVVAKADGRFAKADKQRANIKADAKKAVARARAGIRDFNR